MFSKTCKYGIRAVFYLAVNTDENYKAGAQEIAETLKVPKHFLGKILQILSRRDIISSSKGPGGGFYLNEKNRLKTVHDIIACFDGPDIFTSCILGLPNCSSENPCPLHIQAFAFRDGLKYQLSNQTIEDFAARIERDEIRI